MIKIYDRKYSQFVSTFKEVIAETEVNATRLKKSKICEEKVCRDPCCRERHPKTCKLLEKVSVGGIMNVQMNIINQTRACFRKIPHTGDKTSLYRCG